MKLQDPAISATSLATQAQLTRSIDAQCRRIDPSVTWQAPTAMSQSQPSTFLTASEVELLCAPLKMPHARRRFLDSKGIRYVVDARGNPVVPRDWLLAGSAPRAPTPAPDEAALRMHFHRPHGSRKKR